MDKNGILQYEAGQLHSHLGNDPKDQRSIANRLESELKKKEDDGFNPDPNIPNKGQKPTDLAKEHGHQPSRGAEIDEQIREEEEAEVSLNFVLFGTDIYIDTHSSRNWV
jgi:hypothetical protein